MSSNVITVEQISKQYTLGSIGSGSLRQDLQQAWLRLRKGKRQPIERQGTLMALDSVSFEVKRGEALGIIGSNGSGKSTLLKIISRIIQPTSGQVKGKGRISSMLEVGTGFHQDLTGRENIFISGYTLGMQKTEIQRKFDEIVAFSGVEKFLDTPVKRYSSGMYVRLAFAVSAHLEPDILIVDEVLAVGDADFQQKCIGKMQEGSQQEGRTVLFVSHHLQAISQLCNRAIWLDKGRMKKNGTTSEVLQAYMSSNKQNLADMVWNDPAMAPGNDRVRMKKIHVRPGDGADFLTVRTPVLIEAECYHWVEKGRINMNVDLLSESGECIFSMGSPAVMASAGLLSLQVEIPGGLLNNKSYAITLTVVKDHKEHLVVFEGCLTFQVEDEREGMYYYGEWPGLIRPATIASQLRLLND